ncbi:MAG: VOC family protein [Acidimicrobiia bacterium]|nr:VOC family protein [Acidimicrobiia bacterium]
MRFQRIAPVFPVRDLAVAMAHYEKLGFAARRYEGVDAYAFVERDGIELHLAEVSDLKPRKNMSAVYLYVDDADELYAEWKDAGVDGRLIEPADTSYGLREGACIDRDANLIRFGSSITAAT